MVPRREPFLITVRAVPGEPSVARRVVLWLVALASVVGFTLVGAPLRQGSCSADQGMRSFPAAGAANALPRSGQPAALPRSGPVVLPAAVPLGPAPALAPELRASTLRESSRTGVPGLLAASGRAPDGVFAARAPPTARNVVALSLSPSVGRA